jgi:hypothetical protein
MPTFEFKSPEGKTYQVQGPEGATQEQAWSILQQQLKTQQPAYAQIPPSYGQTANGKSTSAPKAEPKRGFLENAVGAADAAASMVSNMVATPFAQAGGVIRGVTGGNYGTQKGLQQAEAFAQRLQQAAYQPRTEAGRDMLDSMGSLIEKANIPPLIPEVPRIGPLARPAAFQGAGKVADAASSAVDRLRPRPAPMAGMGAAMTADGLRREVEAASLPVPIRLTKGQKTRDFSQIQFERETAKNPTVGAPLRERYAEQNAGIYRNLDAFDEQTGAQARGLRSVGESVVKALEAKDKQVSGKISAAYKAAKDAGQMQEPVSVKALTSYLEENRSVMRNAPVMKTVQDEIKRLTKGKNDVLTISQMEELRKTINKAADLAGPDANYAPKLKELIDAATEGKGGDLYRQARRMAENHFRQFEDRASVRKLMAMNKGDRAVALEDVFDHSILKGSTDDVRHLRRVLQTAGDEGKQAWAELQGQTIRHIKDAAAASLNINERGEAVASASKLNKLITELDKDGKLDFMFGKKGADQLRTLNEVAKDVLTSPKDAVNHSNTASVLAAMADTAAISASHYAGHFLPVPVLSAANYGVRKFKDNRLGKRVNDALGPIAPPP